MGEVSKDAHDEADALRDLPLAETHEYLIGLSEEFTEVRRHYTGPIGRFRRKIKDDDHAQLGEAVNDLRVLSNNTAIREQMHPQKRGVGEFAYIPDRDAQSLILNQVITLEWDVLAFLSRFENTGLNVEPRVNPNDLPYPLP